MDISKLEQNLLHFNMQLKTLDESLDTTYLEEGNYINYHPNFVALPIFGENGDYYFLGFKENGDIYMDFLNSKEPIKIEPHMSLIFSSAFPYIYDKKESVIYNDIYFEDKLQFYNLPTNVLAHLCRCNYLTYHSCLRLGVFDIFPEHVKNVLLKVHHYEYSGNASRVNVTKDLYRL